MKEEGGKMHDTERGMKRRCQGVSRTTDHGPPTTDC